MTFIALTTIAVAGLQAGLTCPVMGGKANFKDPSTEYNGARFAYCCGGCKETFEKAPAKVIEKAVKEKRNIGMFLFDPVSHKRIDHEKAAGTSYYNGIRFAFSSLENKATFDKNPKAYGVLPKKESLFCPVMKAEIKDYASADSYVDHNGVRYYMCCAGCATPFANDAAKFAAEVTDRVKNPAVITTKDK